MKPNLSPIPSAGSGNKVPLTKLKFTIIALQLLMFTLGILATGTLTSCHTAAGFGRDMEHAGEAIENSARDHHHYDDRR